MDQSCDVIHSPQDWSLNIFWLTNRVGTAANNSPMRAPLQPTHRYTWPEKGCLGIVGGDVANGAQRCQASIRHNHVCGGCHPAISKIYSGIVPAQQLTTSNQGFITALQNPAQVMWCQMSHLRRWHPCLLWNCRWRTLIISRWPMLGFHSLVEFVEAARNESHGKGRKCQSHLGFQRNDLEVEACVHIFVAEDMRHHSDLRAWPLRRVWGHSSDLAGDSDQDRKTRHKMSQKTSRSWVMQLHPNNERRKAAAIFKD